jgi:hypothetical protein
MPYTSKASRRRFLDRLPGDGRARTEERKDEREREREITKETH